uniref:Uncharacterized protein n=1 Tax=Arundo donax TaxID=35708 RepID=A0A0A8YXP1_ARUDO
MTCYSPFNFVLLQGECTMLFSRFFETVALWSSLWQVSIS